VRATDPVSPGLRRRAPEVTGYRGVVALDGPSGTGKSTVAQRLAIALGTRYLDTGAMYRAATLAVLRAGAEPSDAAAVSAVVAVSRIAVSTDPRRPGVHLDGEPVDREIRERPVTAAVSAVSAVAAVRAQLVAAQRAVIGGGGIVVEGRDIGTVVWPQADVRVYLTASPQTRARRRAGPAASVAEVAEVAADIARRDAFDSSRAESPLRPASGALTLDTTDLEIDEVVASLEQLVLGGRDG
jgi:cytidylate kinase